MAATLTEKAGKARSHGVPDGFVVRAVTLPVAFPADGRSWADLTPALNGAFRLSTHAANWCVQQMYKRDTPGEARTPQAVKPRGKTNPGGFYAYGEAAKQPWFGAWDGAKQSLNICLRYAERKYRDERFDVLVRHKQNLLAVRFPYPYPVDADAWSCGYRDGGFPLVRVGLPGLGPVGLVLKRAAEFGRQLGQFRQLVEGAASRREAALYRNRKGNLLCKMVGWFPRREPGERTHACLLHTDPNALLVAEIDGRSPWILNADHVNRWSARHRIFLRRAAEDAKRESRMDRRQRSYLNTARELRCEKQYRRIDTAMHQLSVQVARFCERQKVATVAYDDSVQEYLPDGFPWFLFKERLRYKLDGMGVEFVIDGATSTGE